MVQAAQLAGARERRPQAGGPLEAEGHHRRLPLRPPAQEPDLAVAQAGRARGVRGPEEDLRTDPARARVRSLVHPGAEQEFLVPEGRRAVGRGRARRPYRHQGQERLRADHPAVPPARPHPEQRVRHRVVEAEQVPAPRGPAAAERVQDGGEDRRGVAAVVRGALAAQEQRVVARDPGQARVRAVRGPAVRRRERRRPPLLLRAGRRVVVQPYESFPVRVRRRRRRLAEQRARHEERGEHGAPAPAGEEQGARHGREARAREQERPGGEDRARQRREGQGQDDRRAAGHRPAVRPSVGQGRPRRQDQDPGEDERLPVRAAVRRREGVPEQMRRAPLHRRRHRRAQPRPQPPLPARHVPAEEQGPREQRDRRADEGRRGREAVRHREQPGEEVRPGHRGELPHQARVGLPGAEEDGEEHGGREAHPEARRDRRPHQGPYPEGVRHRQTDQEDQGGAQGRHVRRVEVRDPADRHHQRAEQRPAPLPHPLAHQAEQREGDQAVQPHRVVRALRERPAAQRVRGAEHRRPPPRPRAEAAQQERRRGRRDRRLQDGDRVHRVLDVPAREERHQRGERARQVGAVVGQEARPPARPPVEQEPAVRPPPQQVPQVRVERHELVGEVVHGPVARPEGEDPGDGVPAADGDDGEEGGQEARAAVLRHDGSNMPAKAGETAGREGSSRDGRPEVPRGRRGRRTAAGTGGAGRHPGDG